MPRNQTFESLLANDSFIRWMKGCASAEENDYWINWLHQNPNHEHLVKQVEELKRITGSDEVSIRDLEIELKRFEASLGEIESGSSGAGKSDVIRIGRQSRTSWLQAAAIFALLIVSIAFFLTYESSPDNSTKEVRTNLKREFQTEFGEKNSFKLSDGSRIILNANSRLQYASSSSKRGQDVDVWLEGEAYFDITHFEEKNSRHFRVHTSDGVVEVLGTKFIVKTSPKGTYTVLEEGKVRIQVNETESNLNLIMTPGELAHFSSGSDQVEQKTVNTLLYTSWVQDIWMFKQTTLEKVAERIESTYGVKVEIPSENLRKKVLAGSIKSTNLEILKEALSKILHVSVIQKGDTIVIG